MNRPSVGQLMGTEPTDDQKRAAANPVLRPFSRVKGHRQVIPALVEYEGATYELHFDGRMYERKVTVRTLNKTGGDGKPAQERKVTLVRVRDNVKIAALEALYRKMTPG